jgi:hypothetical protein
MISRIVIRESFSGLIRERKGASGWGFLAGTETGIGAVRTVSEVSGSSQETHQLPQ